MNQRSATPVGWTEWRCLCWNGHMSSHPPQPRPETLPCRVIWPANAFLGQVCLFRAFSEQVHPGLERFRASSDSLLASSDSFRASPDRLRGRSGWVWASSEPAHAFQGAFRASWDRVQASWESGRASSDRFLASWDLPTPFLAAFRGSSEPLRAALGWAVAVGQPLHTKPEARAHGYLV